MFTYFITAIILTGSYFLITLLSNIQLQSDSFLLGIAISFSLTALNIAIGRNHFHNFSRHLHSNCFLERFYPHKLSGQFVRQISVCPVDQLYRNPRNDQEGQHSWKSWFGWGCVLVGHFMCFHWPHIENARCVLPLHADKILAQKQGM